MERGANGERGEWRGGLMDSDKEREGRMERRANGEKGEWRIVGRRVFARKVVFIRMFWRKRKYE